MLYKPGLKLGTAFRKKRVFYVIWNEQAKFIQKIFSVQTVIFEF